MKAVGLRDMSPQHDEELTVFSSPKYPPGKLRMPTIEDMIDVYEDRWHGFILDHAKALVDRKNSELAVLQLLIGYFESHATYLTGEDSKNRSAQFFKAGFLDVFGVAQSETPGMVMTPTFLDDLATKLYEDARCGLSHDAMTRHRIMLTYHATAPIGASVHKPTGTIAAIVLNPKDWIAEIEAHLREYLAKLRDPMNADLRVRFETQFTFKNPPGRRIELPPEARHYFR
jgi:hypothetical protein